MYYGVTIESVVKSLYGRYLEKVVLTEETAASYLGIATDGGFPLLFNHTIENNINSQYIQGTYVEELNMEDVVEINGIYCTNMEKTICDMIVKEKDIQAIVESIADYCERNKDISKLQDMVEKLDIEEKFKWYYNESLDCYTDY